MQAHWPSAAGLSRACSAPEVDADDAERRLCQACARLVRPVDFTTGGYRVHHVK